MILGTACQSFLFAYGGAVFQKELTQQQKVAKIKTMYVSRIELKNWKNFQSMDVPL